MIKLSEKIEELRLRDGRTQDALASELGVTAQAVSRWEKEICYPDMELIPSIANYFGVSIDELFGYDNERSKKIDELAARINEMNSRNNGKDVCMDACITLAREALIEFPGNEKLLTSLQSGELRRKAVMELSQLYKNTGAHEKALQLAESAPEITASKPFLRIKAYDGKAAVAAQGEALLETVWQSADLIIHIVLDDTTIRPQEAADLLQNAAAMFALISPDRCYGRNFGMLSCVQMLRSYYLWLAEKKDDAFLALNTALEHARQLDKLQGRLQDGSEEYFASPLLHNVRIQTEKALSERAFSHELPELWPWWDVPEKEKVRAEMQADPRWADFTNFVL